MLSTGGVPNLDESKLVAHVEGNGSLEMVVPQGCSNVHCSGTRYPFLEAQEVKIPFSIFHVEWHKGIP